MRKIREFYLFIFVVFTCLNSKAQSLSVIWPKNNEVISDRTPLLSWNGMEGILNYQISLSQDSTFTSGIQSFTSTSTQFQLTNNLISGTWFWKASGVFNGQTIVSNLAKFQVFQPTDIPDLVVWLSSDSSVVLDANNRVSSWNNLMGTNHFINLNSSSRPFITNTLSSMNNKRAIDFQGAEFLSSQNNFSFGNVSLFLLNSQEVGDNFYGRTIDHSAGSGFWIGRDATNNAIGGGFIETSGTFGNFISIQNDKPLQLSMIRNGSTSFSFSNSVPFPTASRTTSSVNTAPNKIFLGSNISGGQFGKKKIYNIVIYNNNLPEDQRRLVEKYQMDKYAPPVNLGADITPIYQNNGSCVNETLMASNMYTNFLWSTGATTQSIQVTQPGSYWVQTTDIFGRSSRDTIAVNNPEMNIFDFQDTIVCFNSSVSITPNLPVNHTFASWSNGNSNLSQAFDGNDNNQLFNVLFQNTSGCSIQSNKFKILVDSSLFGVSLGQDTSFCSGNTIQLQNPPLNIVYYIWNTGNYLSAQIVDTSGHYILEVTNSNGCNNSDTITVTITGEGPQVTLAIPNILCEDDSLLFVTSAIITSPEIITSIFWNLDDEIFNNGDSVLVSYQNAGTKNIEVSILASNGCSVNLNQSIQINPNPNVQIQMVGSCVYDTIAFSTQNNGFNIQNYSWNLGQNTSSNSPNPTHVYNSAGTYSINVQMTDMNGCQGSSQNSITLSEQLEPYNNSLSIIWPKHNEVISDRTPLLSWNGIEGIQSYQISLSQDSTFTSGIQTFTALNMQFQLINNLISGAWFWKTSGVLNGQSFVSNLGKFQVFEPTDIADLVVWLSSDSSVVLDANNRVSSWNNLVGTNHFVNSNSSSRPFVTNPFSSMNQNLAIDFQGAQFLSSINNFSFTNASIFMVASQSSGDINYGRFLDHDNNTGFWIGRNGLSNAVGGGFIEQTFPFGNFNNVPNDTAFQLSLVRNNASTSYFLNSTQFNSPTRTTSSSTTAFKKIVLGSETALVSFGKKRIYNVLIYSSNLNLNSIKLVESYLMDKYAPPVNLGADITPTYQNNATCVNETITASSVFSNYLWNTGTTASSIQVSQPGAYWVQTTDIFGRVSRDTVIVNNPKMNIFDFQDTLICFYESVQLNPQIPANHIFSSWNNCYPQTNYEISKLGSYFIEFTNNAGCLIRSNVITINVDSSLANITLGADTNLCSGNTIQLQNAPTNITQYAWNTGNAQAIQTIDTTGQYIIEVTNFNNCQNRDTIQVQVIGTSPTLQFTFSDTLCQFSPGSFFDNSFVPNNNGTISSKTWFISNGDTLTGSSGNFVIDTAGVFNVTLLVETQEGCGSSTTFPLVVHPKPIVSFITEKFCPYDAVEFTSSNSQLSTLGSQLWSFDDNTTSNSSNPTHVFGTTGTYNVSLQAEDINGCRDTVSQAVFIQPAPVATFSFDNTCEETEVNFVNNSNIADTFNITTNTWSYGDGTQAINPSFQKVYADADTFDVQLIVTANNGCQDTSLQSIIIYPRPTLGWQVGPACKNTWTTFDNLSSVTVGNIAQTDWLVNLQYPLEGTSSAYQFVTTGVQYLNLTSTTDNGCQRDTLIIVNVQPEINAAYSVSPTTVVAGVPTTFISTSTGATQYTWNIGNNSIETTDIEPVEIPGFDASLIGDSIQTSLIIENTIGCRDTASQYIKVYEPRIDLAITQLFVQDLNGFYKVGVELRNLGFVVITKIDLLLKMYGSLPTLETENESLAPGESRIYLFNASPSAYISTQDNETSYLCVEATSYNDYQLIETELSNNISCLNTEGENFVLLPIYPNPTNDDISYTFILSEGATLNTSLTDETGRIVMEQSDVHPAGLHTQVLSMRNLRAGVYYFHISDGNSAKTVKILKN
jgi:PKD repeat protein